MTLTGIPCLDFITVVVLVLCNCQPQSICCSTSNALPEHSFDHSSGKDLWLHFAVVCLEHHEASVVPAVGRMSLYEADFIL